MKRANTMSTITVELIIKMKTKFTSSNAEKTNGFISPQMSDIFSQMSYFHRKVVTIKTRRYKRQFSGSFFAPETNMIFGDGVGPLWFEALIANSMLVCGRLTCFYIGIT